MFMNISWYLTHGVGERAACYNADLLLRQYQRIRKEYSESDTLEKSGKSGEKKVKFSYKYIRPVYTIVFMETSTEDFHRFPEDYVHTFCPVSDTGLNVTRQIEGGRNGGLFSQILPA